MSFIDEPITLLGDLFKKLGDDEAIIAEFPSGYKRYICKKSRLDKFDAAWPIDRPYEYDWIYKTYHVKLTKYKPGSCDSQEIEPLTLGELVDKLKPNEGIIAEFPNGETRHLTRYSRLDEHDAELPIAKPYRYGELSKTYYVKISTLEMHLSPKPFKLEPGPITLCGICKDLTPSDKMIVEFPNGLTKTYYFYSDLRHLDDEQFLVKSCEYDCPSKTYHVKVEKKYKPGFCEGSQGSIEASKVKEHIKRSLNSYYSIDPKEHDEYNPILQMKNIREYYELLYDKYFKIKRIICDGPATIIFWNDGTKTIVKAQDEVDIEKGILYAALKKLATKKEYDNILRAIDKVDETRNDDPVVEKKETTEKKHPSDQKCPYCGANWNMTIQRSKCLQKHGAISIVCGKCDGMFTVKSENDKYVCRPFYKGGDK